MDKTQYNAIRGEQDFLYRYFIKNGGKEVGNQQFNIQLDFWFMTVIGIHPQQGRKTILNFLDKKFGN